MSRIGKIFFVIIVLQSFLIGYAQAKGAGTTAVTTLTQPVSAKPAGMGEAYTAVSGEAIALHYNPAGLAGLTGTEIGSIYQKGFIEDNFASVVAGKKFSRGGMAVSIMYYDTGEIELYDLAGNKQSKTGQKDIIVTTGFGFAPKEGNTQWGGAIKAISSEIFGEKASAIAVDVGFQYMGVKKNLDLGVSIQNIGGKITYVDKGDDLPLNICIGAAYLMQRDTYEVRAIFDLPYFVNEKEMLGLLGVEYTLNKMFAARAGYKVISSDTDNKINVGIGLIMGRYSFDYAMGIADDLDNPHHISVNMKF